MTDCFLCGVYGLARRFVSTAAQSDRRLKLARVEIAMIDLIYVAGTVAFFGLMLLYVHACERLGRSAGGDSGASEEAKP